MAYHRFVNEDGEEYGSFEVFEIAVPKPLFMAGHDELDPGWWWWACYPGCLPDGDASGPFPTEYDAMRDASDANG